MRVNANLGINEWPAAAHNAPMATSGFAIPPHRRAVVVAGATGLVGQALLDVLLANLTVGAVHVLVRRHAPALEQRNGVQLQVVDYNAGLPALPQVEDAYCCLGTTIKLAGSQARFRAVDFDAVLAFARAARAAGATRLALVSALGADAKSSAFYNRVKGEMELAVTALGFECVVIARPSLLRGNRAALQQPTRRGERIALAATAPLDWLLPRSLRPIDATFVARAMLRAMQQAPAGVHVISSGQMQLLGA